MKTNRIQRQTAILERLREQKSVSVQGLAQEFKVSVMTIHRDLRQLDDEGYVSKQHGGAMIANRFAFSHTNPDRSHLNMAAKKAIGAFAAKHLVNPEDDSLIIDSGSTTLAFVQELPDVPINVMLSSLPALLALSERQHLRVHALGGKLEHDLMAFEGTIAHDILKSCHFSKAFIGTNGIDIHAGFTTANTANAQLTRLMAEQAKEVYVLADFSKFHQRAFASIMHFDHITGIVTDQRVPDEFRQLFDRHRIQLFEVDHRHEN